MAFPEYQLRQNFNLGWIRESEEKSKWIFGKRKRVSATSTLEDDIYRLRQEMEQLVQSGNSLTSSRVVEISMELDIKINEYMQGFRRSRS
ncbi:aspartyl-phosphate phosphatase Spo0E family protein [Paenibacillus sp. S-38]|uniref:aspartyl-phosphate phosphatase Spo0E family protein n=1 Tax=Paenibacillus sp. S-38 TaxID=3416710 RepID=UPI003CF33E8D